MEERLETGVLSAMSDVWKPDELEDRLLDFAVRCCHVVEAMPDSKVGRHVAGQLVRCATSPAPNYSEACGAESGNDFIHKLRISLKELRETRTWIKFIIKYELLPQPRMTGLLSEAEQLCSILGKSIHTARKNQTQEGRP
jgi:four helix bundle protein